MKEIVIKLNDTDYESLTSSSSVVVELATIRNLIDAVIHGKVLEQTEWIPVSCGKFPTSYVAVEVTVIRKDKTWNQTPYIRLAEWHEGLKDWFEIPYPIDQPFGERLSESDGGDATVVAWRPLPEPYKGDTE